jgi:hypothetical protein
MLALLVCLGVSVLMWGTEYKLSLYGSMTQTTHQMPEAKLSTRHAAPLLLHEPASAAMQDGRFSPLAGLICAFLVAWLTVPGICRRFSPPGAVSRIPLRISFSGTASSFLFRPPPARA